MFLMWEKRAHKNRLQRNRYKHNKLDKQLSKHGVVYYHLKTTV